MKKHKNKRFTKRIFELLTTFAFVAGTVGMGIAFFVSPKSGYSEIERRKLTELPEGTVENIASGEYTDGITKYVSDNFAFRDKLVKLAFDLEDKRGIRADGIKIYNDSAVGNKGGQIKLLSVDEPLKQIKKAKPQRETALLGEEVLEAINLEEILELDIYDDITEEQLVGEQRGALFMLGDKALEIFYGNEGVCNDYVNIINAYRASVPANVNVYDLVIPTHFEFGLPEKYKSQVGRGQKQFLEQIYSGLDASVVAVDIYPAMYNAYAKGEYIYFRSDHHWTARGAYKAYSVFARKAGFKPTPLSEFEHKRIDKFLGTLYSSTYDKNLAENPDYVEYFKPKTEYTVTNYHKNGVDTYEGSLLYEAIKSDSSGYLVFMGGDIPLSVIETNNNTGRSIIVFKESYGNAFIPFLVTSFDKVYVADIRTFPFNAVNYVVENSITDVLFLNNTITSCTPPRIQNYLNMLSK